MLDAIRKFLHLEAASAILLIVGALDRGELAPALHDRDAVILVIHLVIRSGFQPAELLEMDDKEQRQPPEVAF